MTFDDIVTEVKDRLGYTSSTSTTRVGRAVNRLYREVGTSIGLQFSRQLNTSVVVTVGNANVTFTGTEKVIQVWRLDGSSNPIILDEVLLLEMRDAVTPDSDKPTEWALYSTTSNGVTVRLNAAPKTAYTLYADVIKEVSDLATTDEPAFPESFHDILIEGVLKDEYRKLEKVQLARDSEATFQRRLSDLRMFVAKSAYLNIQQGKHPRDATSSRAGSGSSGSINLTALNITGEWTFDRDPSAPFVVTDASAYVANLYAEGVGNITTDRLIGRDAAGTGESEQLTVGGGIEFTGSGGIQTSAFTGDVTKAAGGTALTLAAAAVETAMVEDNAVTFAKMQDIATDRLIGRDTAATGDPEEISVTNGLAFTGSTSIGIANDGVTYARMQNVTAASRLIGRGASAGAGDPEEITLGTGLSMTGTTIQSSTAPDDENSILAVQVFGG